MGREEEWEGERRTGPVYGAGGGREGFVGVPEEGGGVGEVAVGDVWLALEDEKGVEFQWSLLKTDTSGMHAALFWGDIGLPLMFWGASLALCAKN